MLAHTLRRSSNTPVAIADLGPDFASERMRVLSAHWYLGCGVGPSSPSRPLRVSYAIVFHIAGPDNQDPCLSATQVYGTYCKLIGDPRHNLGTICRGSAGPRAAVEGRDPKRAGRTHRWRPRLKVGKPTGN